MLTGSRFGCVYVIDFGSCVKVGLSIHVKQRVHELEKSTGLTAVTFFHIETDHATYLIEKLTHEKLSEFHLKDEYFCCSFDVAKNALLEVYNSYEENAYKKCNRSSSFLSVSEFATKFGKDPRNVRRLIANGRIPAQKLGKQWLIPADAEPPADKRVKSGEYRNWRKKTDSSEGDR